MDIFVTPSLNQSLKKIKKSKPIKSKKAKSDPQQHHKVANSKEVDVFVHQT